MEEGDNTEQRKAVVRDPEISAQHQQANLRQSIWELTQFRDREWIENYIAEVFAEIESDDNAGLPAAEDRERGDDEDNAGLPTDLPTV